MFGAEGTINGKTDVANLLGTLRESGTAQYNQEDQHTDSLMDNEIAEILAAGGMLRVDYAGRRRYA